MFTKKTNNLHRYQKILVAKGHPIPLERPRIETTNSVDGKMVKPAKLQKRPAHRMQPLVPLITRELALGPLSRTASVLAANERLCHNTDLSELVVKGLFESQ